jgi:hypothetical protein
MENQEIQEQQEAPKPELSIADLQNLRTLVDLATRRGAFGAGEMTSVGAVFDRVNTFLNAVAPVEKAEEPGTQA